MDEVARQIKTTTVVLAQNALNASVICCHVIDVKFKPYTKTNVKSIYSEVVLFLFFFTKLHGEILRTHAAKRNGKAPQLRGTDHTSTHFSDPKII